MLKDLINNNGDLHIGGKKYKVRFSLNSMLYLEICGLPFSFILSLPPEKWDIDTVILLTRACLCSLPENEDAVNRRNFELVCPSVYELGEMIRAAELPALRKELSDLINDAFPDPTESPPENDSHEATDEGHMRAIYCDIMHRPESEFWGNTYKSNLYRINHYLEAKGLKEKAVEIQMYDKSD